MSYHNKKSDAIHNELKTGEPAYDGKLHSEHYRGKGCSFVLLVVCSIISILGGGIGILIRIATILYCIFNKDQ
jgi:hypothetical protein